MKLHLTPMMRKKALGAVLLTTFVGMPLMVQPQPAEAQIFRRGDRYERDRYDRDRDYRTRYDRDNRTDNRTFSGTVTNVRSDKSFDLRANGRTYNVYAVNDLPRRLNENDEVRVYGRPYGENDIRNANVVITDNNNRNGNRRDNRYDNRRDNRYDRDRYDRDRDYRDRYDRDNRTNNQTFTGTVTNVRSDTSFDIRVNGRIYNVYAVGTLPRRLNQNDEVRVYGRAYGTNDIRNANVVIIDNNNRNGNRYGNRNDNRYDNRNDNRYDPYDNGRSQTFTGEVVNLRNNREFDIRAGGTTYNVYASSNTPNLNEGDTVRVYGQRIGTNDIRNANVTVTRNGNGNGNRGGLVGNIFGNRNRNNGNDDNGDYRNYRGTVTNVKNSREFDVRIDGKTYNVYASSDTRGLDDNDEVRIYGQRIGENDIRNANVRITRNR